MCFRCDNVHTVLSFFSRFIEFNNKKKIIHACFLSCKYSPVLCGYIKLAWPVCLQVVKQSAAHTLPCCHMSTQLRK